MAQKALECCWRFPAPLEDGLHSECGKLQRLLAVPPLRLSRRRAMQHVEGSEQGPFPLSLRPAIRRWLLAKGQSYTDFCLKAQRATQRSSLDAIA